MKTGCSEINTPATIRVVLPPLRQQGNVLEKENKPPAFAEATKSATNCEESNPGRLDCAIITSESEAAALSGEWQALHEHAGHSLFTDYGWFDIWWRVIGRNGGYSLHIITGRLNGKLVALLPLAIIRRKGFRILQPAGAEAFFQCDMLCEDLDHAIALWKVAHASPHYDFAHLRDICPDAPWEPALAAFAQLHDRDKSYYLSIEWPTSDAWKAVSPIVRRRKLKEHARRLKRKGDVRFEICRSLPVPAHVVDGMIEQKTAWCLKHGREGVFSHPDVRQYYHQLISYAARNGSLALAWLACGTEIIAWHLMFTHKHKLCSFIPATHEEWLVYSPGHLINIEGVSWAIDNGFKEFDHMQGDFSYKQLFANNARECREYIFHRSWKGWLGAKLFVWRRAVKRFLVRRKLRSTKNAQ